MVKGFFAGNDAYLNSKALQAAVDIGGEIRIDEPGIYDVAEQINIGSDTSLVFGAGVYIRRQSYEGEMGLLFVNKGAYTKEYDRNIKIIGLNLITNDVQCAPRTPETKNAILGFRAHLGFLFVEDLVIRDFICRDLNTKDYAIQICKFRNVLIENVRIEGLKDGIHFGPGSGFTIRHGVFCTFDDPIALNGSDFAPSNPYMGWIENGLIEDCYDMHNEKTTGYFVRLLSGAWVDWYSGMKVQHSDAVVYNGKIYRVVMPVDGKQYVSVNPPDFEYGTKEIDGIRWYMTQEEILYTAGCKNITFRDIHLQKKRWTAFRFEMDQGKYLRSYYPNAQVPVVQNIVFDNISVENEVKCLVSASGAPDSVKIINSNLGTSRILFSDVKEEGLVYPVCSLNLVNNTLKETAESFVSTDNKLDLNMSATSVPRGYAPRVSPNVNVVFSDIELKK